jgi:predicted DNA-binding protein (MmcQ/YjbR family)
MNAESFRTLCLGLPHATEDVKWGHDLVFSIGGKMFAVACLEPKDPHRASFKCTPEDFGALVEREGIGPAPYAARYHWVALERFDALPDRELRRFVRDAYEIVKSGLPRKLQQQLEGKGASAPAARGRKRPRRRR